jgi:transposase
MVLLYLGLTPGEQQSGDRNPKRGITKEGDTLLRRLLVQCAHYILRSKSDSDLKCAGLRIMSNGGHKSVAVTAIARKLAVLLHDLWVMGEVYEPLHNHKPDANSATGADSEVAPTQVT